MELLDTHCHLTTVDTDLVPEIIKRAKECFVKRYICVGASEKIISAHQAVQLAEKYPEIWASVGIHPHDADSGHSISELEQLATHKKVVAIGETGLDYFRDWANIDNQKKLFKDTISLARSLKKPLIIHCREAKEDVFNILKSCNAKEVGGVFHCYSEDFEFAKQLEEINFIVSFTGSLTFKKASELRNTAKQISLERIMLETDMPYMAPEPFRGNPSEPMHVYQIALQMAEIHEVTVEEIARISTQNAERIFGLA